MDESLIREQRKSNILIFQMGRVGSLSVKQALKGSGFRPLHVHYMYDPIEPGHGSGKDYGFIKAHLQEPVKIITIIRDPVARSVSAWTRLRLRRPYTNADSTDAIKWIEKEENWKWAIRWWRTQFDKFTGTDTITMFRKKGLKTYKNIIYDSPAGLVLVLRNENLDNQSGVLSTFVNCKVKIGRYNVTGGTWKASRDAFLELIDKIKFSEEFLNKVYNTRVIKSAYSHEEIEVFKERWAR